MGLRQLQTMIRKHAIKISEMELCNLLRMFKRPVGLKVNRDLFEEML